MGMSRLGFEVAEVGRGGRERTVAWTVDIKPGMRRTTRFCMLGVFCEPLSLENNNRGGETPTLAPTCTLIHWQLGGGYNVKDKVANILIGSVMIIMQGTETSWLSLRQSNSIDPIDFPLGLSAQYSVLSLRPPNANLPKLHPQPHFQQR